MRVTSTHTPTTEEYLAEIASYAQYERNWDSYDGDPIAPQTMEVASAFIRMLDAQYLPCVIYPNPNGGIEMDWCAVGDGEHWLFIQTDGTMEYSIHDGNADLGKMTPEAVIAELQRWTIHHQPNVPH